jgi:uncharacterized protein (TIGR00375 family)
MSYFADLHVHSSYSRATSKDMMFEPLWQWAQLKGITILGTGDFTHPAWLSQLNEKLKPTGSGLYRLKSEYQNGIEIPHTCQRDVFFLLSAEISCIFRKGGKTRKVHCLLFVPELAQAKMISSALAQIGNISSDGRPILGLDAKELLKIVLDITPDALFVPAHAWTPHFSIFGSESGFDSLEECFEDLTPYIYAIETGLSSDPSMNWRLSNLDRLTLISNSDAHSPSKLGREANVLDTDLSFDSIVRAIKTKKGFLGTIEFFPEEGKYHYDGHRACQVCFSPRETIEHRAICPKCGKHLTIGVAHRVELLADRNSGFTPINAPPFTSVIPLVELLSEVMSVGPQSKTVGKQYLQLLSSLGSEFTILLKTSISDIKNTSNARVAEAISRMRDGVITIKYGYDGEYGRIGIFNGKI